MYSINRISNLIAISVLSLIILQCNKDDGTSIEPKDPNTATIVSIDRFSDEAAVLMKRSADPSLPGPGEPIDFDSVPFITQSLGPDGEIVRYYNFDVQPLEPAPVYVFFYKSTDQQVTDQLNILDVKPGDQGYTDFWQMVKVLVPDNYEANTAASYQDIIDQDYETLETSRIINCPVVPKGSRARLRYAEGDTSLNRGWYKSQLIYYFTFVEKDLEVNSIGQVPLSPIYVTFNINPDPLNPDSGPPSGFVTEPGGIQTHNVIKTIPEDTDYSPLWIVYIYDNTYFDNVSDLTSVLSLNLELANMNVNCPVVYVEE